MVGQRYCGNVEVGYCGGAEVGSVRGQRVVRIPHFCTTGYCLYLRTAIISGEKGNSFSSGLMHVPYTTEYHVLGYHHSRQCAADPAHTVFY